MRALAKARVLLLALVLSQGVATGWAEEGDAPPASGGEGVWARGQLLGDPWGGRSRAAEQGFEIAVAYTADVLSNVSGGEARKTGFLGNVDATLTWDTAPLMGRDLGSFFLYGLWNHGDRPTDAVGDLQTVDNIEAPDSAKLYEAWWQKALLGGDASILLGIYDVNSEFYAIDSAELFVHSSFGTGAELGTSGVNGPSIFPTAGVGARVKIEPIVGYDFQLAVVEGIPGDPRRPKGTRIDFDSDEGVFLIAELGHHRSAAGRPDEGADARRGAYRRRVGRGWAQHPGFLRLSMGSWLYTARQPHVSSRDAGGEPIKARGHPGLYVTAEFDADRLDPLHRQGLSVFSQLGFADGDVGPFAGYVGAGIVYTGLLPFRPDDESGFAVAAAFAGDALRDATRDEGRRPARAEIALEWTHRIALTGWLALQGDVQLIVNPGSVRDRPDAWIVGTRWVVDL